MEQLITGLINGALTNAGLSFFDKIKKNKLENKIISGQANPEDYFKLQIILSQSEIDFTSSNNIMKLFIKQYPTHTFPYSTLGGNIITNIIIEAKSREPNIIVKNEKYNIAKPLIEEGFRIMKSGINMWKPINNNELIRVFIPKSAQLYYLKGLTLHIAGETEEAQKLKNYACELENQINNYKIY